MGTNGRVKTLLLAAGYGTRLQPITNKTPKCLVEVGGRPLLEHWLRLMESAKCDKILINTHYLSEQVNSFLQRRSKGSVPIKVTHEKELLGTAGTLIENRRFFGSGTGMMVHVDNMAFLNIDSLIEAHQDRPKGCLLTMLTFSTPNPSECGIVELDKNGVVQRFHEKSKNPPGNIANGAVYLFEKDLLDYMETTSAKISDFSTEVLPNLEGRIYTVHTDHPYIDIGTPERLSLARSLWPN
ncbi:nucleotidyltransferase family protein [Synechococcus sp. KORDI-100]|uniref:nucleotidyltransferase family protein n=1 Tax=Synechococcus sp. KORDI-100 TaxID=1280380 RepID=UPI0008FF9E90|nr:nucleotidyltransferase family protein [Synechococcus sp. KORDI-100]